MSGGLAWGGALLWLGSTIRFGLNRPLTISEAMALALFLPGLVLMAMIGRLAQQRFFHSDLMDGAQFAPNSGPATDQKVLQNTIEQLVLALCVWPLAVHFVGAGVVLALGTGFAIARIFFWIGYHISPPLRGFGFAASFYPTILVALWTMGKIIR